jgi:hypothetical protein
MKCAAHGTDGCAACKPAIGAAWTAGQLKAALAEIPDGTPLVAWSADADEPDVAEEQLITRAGFGTVDWGDGYGPEADTYFGLECEIPGALLRTRPDRPRRQAADRVAPAQNTIAPFLLSRTRR